MQLTRCPRDRFERRHAIVVHRVQQEQELFIDDRLLEERLIGQGGEAGAAITQGTRVLELMWRIGRRSRL